MIDSRQRRRNVAAALLVAGWIGIGCVVGRGEPPVPAPPPPPSVPQQAQGARDAAAEVVAPPATAPSDQQRPEQQQNAHDKSADFSPVNAPPQSTAFGNQPEQGKFEGFDFARDPLDAKRPMQTAQEILQQDMKDKPRVMQLQQQVLQSRYDLTPHPDPKVTMFRGKPICVGPTAKLK